jgi:hypothetical protein
MPFFSPFQVSPQATSLFCLYFFFKSMGVNSHCPFFAT